MSEDYLLQILPVKVIYGNKTGCARLQYQINFKQSHVLFANKLAKTSLSIWPIKVCLTLIVRGFWSHVCGRGCSPSNLQPQMEQDLDIKESTWGWISLKASVDGGLWRWNPLNNNIRNMIRKDFLHKIHLIFKEKPSFFAKPDFLDQNFICQTHFLASSWTKYSSYIITTLIIWR